MSAFSAQVREMFRAGDDIRDAGLTTPKEIQRFDDVLYGNDEKWQKLDVYRPKDKKGLLPVIVSVHGGAWMYGDKERYQYYCMDLAQRGFAVVNFTYRLAPEYTWPANIEDTNLVFTWVLKHSEEYGLDTDHIFAVGDSAGGSNLGLYAAILTNKEYASQYAFQTPHGLKLQAIALNSAAFYIDEMLHQYMQDYMPLHGTEQEEEMMDMRKYITEEYPPAFLMTAEEDPLKGLAGPMAIALADKNVPFVYHYYVGKEEQIGHVFHLNIRQKDAVLCNDEECNFFRSFL